MQRLLEGIFLPAFGVGMGELGDAVAVGGGWVLSTDAHVVSPLFFPGGDIGTLAVNGTCNDLAMVGAEPKFLALTWILEEGLDFGVLRRIAESVGKAAEANGVRVIAGDTKVVPRGKCDGLYLSAAGIGMMQMAVLADAKRLEPGMELILSGDVGRHAIAVLSVRDSNFGFVGGVESDCCGLWKMVKGLLEAGVEPIAMRDCTRGGLATVLAEWAEESGFGLEIEEWMVPVIEPVKGVCELMGYDPMYLACEGRFVLAVKREDVERAVEILRSYEEGVFAERIGKVSKKMGGRVVARQRYGTERVLDRLSGEILPRIC